MGFPDLSFTSTFTITRLLDDWKVNSLRGSCAGAIIERHAIAETILVFMFRT